MNILDENIPRDQADLLNFWGIRCRSLSRDLASQGIADDDILPLLLRLKNPTLLTRDEDFFQRHLVHAGYCLVYFQVGVAETAFFIRRFLRHPDFQTSQQRLGKIIRVHPAGIAFWERKSSRAVEVSWGNQA